MFPRRRERLGVGALSVTVNASGDVLLMINVIDDDVQW